MYLLFVQTKFLMFSRTARDLAELMSTIDAERHRLEAHYQTYIRTITQSDPFVSD
jgi:hypothetical protein